MFVSDWTYHLGDKFTLRLTLTAWILSKSRFATLSAWILANCNQNFQSNFKFQLAKAGADGSDGLVGPSLGQSKFEI